MRLAGAGHRDVFEYGWSAFVEALEAEAQRRDERMKDAALACVWRCIRTGGSSKPFEIGAGHGTWRLYAGTQPQGFGFRGVEGYGRALSNVRELVARSELMSPR